MITLAKSLGGGVPVGAVLIRNEVADSVNPGEQGTTFGGGMLAMAAVEAALRVIVEEDLPRKAVAIYAALEKGCAERGIKTQGAGCLVGMDFSRPVSDIVAGLRNKSVLTGGSSNPHVMRLMPPAVVTEEEIALFFTALDEVMS